MQKHVISDLLRQNLKAIPVLVRQENNIFGKIILRGKKEKKKVAHPRVKLSSLDGVIKSKRIAKKCE